MTQNSRGVSKVSRQNSPSGSDARSRLLAAFGLAAAAMVAATLGGCAGAEGRVPAVSDSMVSSAGGASRGELESGRNILLTKCNRCHSVYEPASQTRAEWDFILPKMCRKANLASAEKSQLESYISAALAGSTGTPANVQAPAK